MNATLTQPGTGLEQLKMRLRATWMAGDYDVFSRYMEGGAKEFYQRLDVAPGTALLDVACGSGQLALIAARAGANVTGCDIATNWLDSARRRAAAESLNARFDEGDAEALPYPDSRFDVVASLVGAMFAPRPDLVAAELTRVCRPGGRIAMVNWTPGGFIGQMFKIIARHIAPPGMPSPVLWGDEATVKERFNGGIRQFSLTRRMYPFEYPFPPHEVVEFFRVHYGPMAKAFASVSTEAQSVLRDELTDLWANHNRAGAARTAVEAEYLEVVAVKG